MISEKLHPEYQLLDDVLALHVRASRQHLIESFDIKFLHGKIQSLKFAHPSHKTGLQIKRLLSSDYVDIFLV